MEDDIGIRAAQVQATGRPQLAVYDTTSENDLVWGVGLGCHGVVTVLIEPVPLRPAWATAAAAALAGGPPCELVTVWDKSLGLPLGTRTTSQVTEHAAALGFEGGQVISAASKGGQVISGSAEGGQVISNAAGRRAEGGQVISDSAKARGIYRQRVVAPPALWIFGAGDDAQPLAKLAADLGWSVTVADPRPLYATSARFPFATAVSTGTVPSLLGKFVDAVRPLEAGKHAATASPTLAVIMTHHYIYDKPLLQGLLGQPLAYLGLLGPRKRAERLLQEIGQPEAEERLHAPVGLDIGAEGAEEVALSILAEMRATLAGRDGRPLRDRNQPIHASDA